ncbi:hypothetical protein ABZZ79_03440 [Streptomyces sp. NPDC006458]|uniref:hypothetical protein n=1 Tax=Streptomyces sp. NPDC006458 TaxID=3154302 RepID=UPI0033BB6DB3
MPTRAQRPRLPEVSDSQRKARQEWNSGKVGQSRTPADLAVVEVCTVDGCGDLADQPRPAAGMVRVEVADSREPARWYCPVRCAAIGRALADLATIPVRGAGE